MPDKRLVIIDGYSLLYRAFFATRYLSTADGRPTNALYGFTSMLFVLLENVKPDAIVVALDAPGKTFRHAEYAEYKGTRRETQDELKVQLPLARDLIDALGIPQKEVTGYEADDVVGTISRLAENNGYDTTIVTGDLDSLQLVDECVSVLTMLRGVTDTITYTPDRVTERYGFGPEFIPDYKAIVGDTSDNIPGVPGIGEKGAAQLITEFGTIEQMLERYDEIPEKFRKKIDPVKEQLPKSKWLATIKCDAPIEYDFKPFVLTAEQMQKAREWMESMEFRNHVRRMDLVLGPYLEGMRRETPVTRVAEAAVEVTSAEEKDFDGLRAWVGERPYSLLLESAPAQASMFDETERGAFVAVDRDVRRVSEALAIQLLSEAPDRAILHDSKPLYKRIGKPLPAPRFDTMLAGYVLQSGRSAYALRDLVQGYLDFGVPTSPEQMAASTWLLEAPMRDRLHKEGQTQVLDNIELPLVPILAEMENRGICASATELQEFSKTLEVTIARVQALIYEMAKREFNIASPKQLGEVLFDELQIPGPKKTKTGYATGAEVLQVLAAEHPICGEVLNWRELTKLKSTYADSLHKLIRADGRIHTTYYQTGAATGRLSSNDPNLQNIPIRTELGREIRRAFHAAPGHRLASLDYSQIELRVLAHLCGDENMIEAFATREDVHTVTAALMYNVPHEQVTKDQRRYSKMLNYAVSYGVTDFGLAQQLGGDFSVAEAREFITRYFERFPKVKAYMDGVVQEARSKGFTTTIYGRRRYFGDIHALNRNERMGAERQAMNAPIQGAAADMMKLAMIQVHKLLRDAPTHMLLTVHDELVFEVPEGGEAIVEPIRSAMENALPLAVPVEVDAKIGENWRDMTIIPRPG